jgi:hypothetical protein
LNEDKRLLRRRGRHGMSTKLPCAGQGMSSARPNQVG